MPKSTRKALVEDVPSDSEDAANLTSLNNLLGFHMRMAEMAMHRDFISTLREVDLTQKLTAVLMLLEDNPGQSQIWLSNVLGTDRATIMAMVDRLEERDLIYRTRSRVDRRRQELYLSRTGMETLSRAHGLIKEHEARFKALFKDDEFQALVGFLKRFYPSTNLA